MNSSRSKLLRPFFLIAIVFLGDILPPDAAWAEDAETAADIQVLKNHPSHGIMDLAYSPDGKILAATGGYRSGRKKPHLGFVKIWDVATGKIVFQQLEFPNNGGHLCFSPNGELLAVSCGHWNTFVLKKTYNQRRQSSWQLKGRLPLAINQNAGFGKKGILGGVHDAVSFSPDSQILAHSNKRYSLKMGPDPKRSALLWDMQDLTSPKAKLKPIHYPVMDVKFLPNGKLLTVEYSYGKDHTRRLCLWDASTQEIEQEVLLKSKSHRGGYSRIALSADGAVLVVTISEAMVILNGATLEIKQTVQLERTPRMISVSPNGKYIAITETLSFQIWNAKTGAFILKRSSGPNGVVRFSPDGKTLATSLYHDKGVELRNLKQLLSSRVLNPVH